MRMPRLRPAAPDAGSRPHAPRHAAGSRRRAPDSPEAGVARCPPHAPDDTSRASDDATRRPCRRSRPHPKLPEAAAAPRRPGSRRRMPPPTPAWHAAPTTRPPRRTQPPHRRHRALAGWTPASHVARRGWSMASQVTPDATNVPRTAGKMPRPNAGVARCPHVAASAPLSAGSRRCTPHAVTGRRRPKSPLTPQLARPAGPLECAPPALTSATRPQLIFVLFSFPCNCSALLLFRGFALALVQWQKLSDFVLQLFGKSK
ncbi:hypothetical protein U9M48_041802 [Paspalum notatum var. saurae]|uniref:Uncharacterized protein n=1 Tax=Paspalum notatum var. saurae TaxID=547442 RepID=A0AAQ3URE8_PASNO